MAQITQDFINRVKEVLKYQPIPPKYHPDEWEDKKFNCYAYAMRICLNLSGYEIRPGFICGRNDYKPTKEYTIEYFLKDCEVLGLQVVPTTISEPLSNNDYKIAVYVRETDYTSDFHFARQDNNGQWSEKIGWYRKISVLNKKELIKHENKYELIGIFKVSKK